MAQSRKGSLFESITNIAVGYLLSLVTMTVVLPMFGVRLPMHDNALIVLVFTVVSLIRGYFLRRLFVRLHD